MGNPFSLDAAKYSWPPSGITQATRTYGNQEVPPIPITTESSGAVASTNTNTGLVGVNTNIGIGDFQYGQRQAGRQLGGITLGIA